jgi:hypothetical protein
VLAKDLDAIAAQAQDAGVKALCAQVSAHYKYPVDSVLLAPDGSFAGHVNAHDLGGSAARYARFLRDGLARARGEQVVAHADEAADRDAQRQRDQLGRPAVVLTPLQPSSSVLDVVQRRGFGASSMTFIAIDTSAFATVGVLEITVRLGTSQAPGKFELCTAPSSAPHLMQPTKSVRLTPGETTTMVVDGADGARFGLAAMPGPAAAEGEVNAFLATITVRSK